MSQVRLGMAAAAVALTLTVADHAYGSGGALPRGIHLGRDGRYRNDLCDHSQRRFCLSKRILPSDWKPGTPVPAAGGGGGGAAGMGPEDIQTAYQIPAGTSAGGKIVAILDSPDSNAYSDLTAYRANYNLPTLPKCAGATGLPDGTTPCFAQVSETGGPSSGQDSGGDSDGETSLDMDMISAACPDCAILLVEISLNSDNDFVTGVQTAAMLGASATSISIGGPESGSDPMGYTTPGHLVLAATGDWGYDLVDLEATTPSYPASSPDVLGVGGTTLFLNGSTYDEAVWNDGTFSTAAQGQDVTTSGCSTEFPMPSFQSAALSGTGCSSRGSADVSAAAAYYLNGTSAYIATYQQGWQQVEGTSASSPMVAALLTRLGLTDPISNSLSWVYTNAAAFNDLGGASYPVDSQGATTDSPNPTTCGRLCNAGPGWDGPSGVGTPNGKRLAALAQGGTVVDDAGMPLPEAGPESDASPDSAAGDDASPTDAGSVIDTGTAAMDSGVPSVPDAGTHPWIIATDAALGETHDGIGSPHGGCACSVPARRSSPFEDGGAMLAALGLVATVRARRRRRT